ncbi:hypothetical protein HZA38_05980 [Candidatus Peregrinibacteria bacterium]|nr:hypothetical protein [Candidatus Peregrinibacteria bacterium]
MPDFEQFEQGDAQGSGTQEVSEEAYDQFRDQYRKTQAAVQKIRKQEAKKKKQDFTLAHIIVQFLHDPRFTRFFVVISRLVAKNIPSDLLLVILSLIHKESAEAIQAKLLKAPNQDVPLEKENASPFFPQETKAEISQWTRNIFSVATSDPHRMLETILDYDWNLDENLVLFKVMVMQEFFNGKSLDVPPLENLDTFSRGFFQTLVKTLENQVHEQNVLSGNVDADFEETADESNKTPNS